MDALEKSITALRLMCLGRLPKLSVMFEALLTYLRKEASNIPTTSHDIPTEYLPPMEPEHSCDTSSAQDEPHTIDFHHHIDGYPQLRDFTPTFIADHIIVVFKSDVEEGRFVSPPRDCYFLRIPDPRAAFVVVFSNEQFEVWKNMGNTPQIYPHIPYLCEEQDQDQDQEQGPRQEQGQGPLREINVEKSRPDGLTLSGFGSAFTGPIHDAAKKAFDALRRIEGQFSSSKEGQNLERDVVRGNTFERTGPAGNLKVSMENNAHSKESTLERERGSNAYLSLVTDQDFEASLSVVKEFGLPKSRVVRMYLIRRFINRELKRGRQKQKREARQVAATTSSQ
ncbi:hypothetical protein PENSTE_c003G08606 [Penicillium steckii]|uniref:Uncharacterized protein n=1 Tax=Penicillium steckii TaxID=303698 RepID=A0A1V6TQG9_9EURO|nr:hypothetical protein PENSTE_c003G08606 [Penicillium steckii]